MKPLTSMPSVRVECGDCRLVLQTLPAESVQCCVTSPPYWGLRDYGHPGQIGQEETPEAFVAAMVQVFRDVRRVLKSDGTCWLNLGDTYANTNRGHNSNGFGNLNGSNLKNRDGFAANRSTPIPQGLKPKDLIGIPWRVAFALQADGWWLRQDIIWCLSGGTWVYARTIKGDMPMMLRDAARLNPSTVKLWNGTKWTQVLGWSKTSRKADELEIVLRSGERISCTPTHQFPTARGLLTAADIRKGDRLQRVMLPEPDQMKAPSHIGLDAAWLAGLYIAEGSMSDDCIQISGHASQTYRFERVRRIAESYGGTATVTIDGNKQNIRVYGKLICALLDELVTGRTAHDKAIAPPCWRYSNEFLRAILDGYLSGDGHYDAPNNRWRLGFTRNYNLERDMRTLAARLGFKLKLTMCFVEGFGEKWPAFKGEIRFETSGHPNEKSPEEVVEIRRSRCREVYDVGVEDEPHLFALSSGILTHNSKPNPMPESVTDRCTKSHEYIFLLSKSERYYYNHEAIKERQAESSVARLSQDVENQRGSARVPGKTNGTMKAVGRTAGNKSHKYVTAYDGSETEEHRTKAGLMKVADVPWESRNKRSVWNVATQPYKEAHFATYPPDLIKPCILAGSRPGDMILDPFGGSGTTGQVAIELGRSATLIELNPDYTPLIRKRTCTTPGLNLP